MHAVNVINLLLVLGLAYWVWRQKNRERELCESLERNDRDKRAVFTFLNNLGERITTTNLALEPALEIITDYILDAADAEAGAVFLLDEEHNELAAQVVQGMFPPLMPTSGYVLTKQKFLSERVKREKIPLGQGIVGEAAATGLPILVSDARNDSRVPRTELDYLSIRSIMVAPMKARGRITGVFAVVNKKGLGTFSEHDLELLLTLTDQAASTAELVKLYDAVAEKQRIEQELRIAHDFQKMLLPERCPEVAGYELAAFSAPALEVGGDYYDFFFIDDQKRHLAIVIADVSGKGIPGAFIMSMVRCTLRAEARDNLSPKEVMLRANERIYADTAENVFITMTYGILDTWEGKFRFVRAGHEPLVTVKQDTGQVRLTSPDGIALGMVVNDVFCILEETVMQLEPGDTALLYTDGVVEAMDEQANEYGQQRFFDLVSANCGRHPKEIIEKALTDIDAFTHGYPQHDDITMLAIRVLQRSAEPCANTTAMPSAGA